MSAEDLDVAIDSVRHQSARIHELASLLRVDDLPGSILGLDELVQGLDKVRTGAESLRSDLRRRRRAATENERLSQLRRGLSTENADIAIAILRGDLITARDAVARLSELSTSAPTVAKLVVAALHAVITGGPEQREDLERAVQMLRHVKLRPDNSDENPLWGAFLVVAGRFYRDVLENAYLARCALVLARTVLKDDPEPNAELAELDRRVRDREASRARVNEALRLGDHRAAPLLVAAALDEDASLWSDAAQRIELAVGILISEHDPVSALDRIAPASLGSAYFALARRLEERDRAAAVRALDRALDLGIHAATTHPLAEVYEKRGSLRSSAADLYEAGRRFLWRTQYDATINALERATHLDPNHGLAWVTLAEAYRMRAFVPGTLPDERTRWCDRAFEAMTRGVALLPVGEIPAWALCTGAYIAEVQANAGGLPLPVDALLMAEHALARDPDASQCLLAAGRMHQKAGHIQTAAALLERAYALYPADLGVLEERLRIHTNTCEYEEALALIPKLPDSPWRRGVEAVVRYKSRPARGTDAEVAALKLVVSLVENALPGALPDSLCWMNMTLAQAHFALGNTDEAQACFARARLAQRSFIEKAEMAIWSGDFAAAIAVATQGLEDPTEDDGDFQMMLVVACLGAGETATAEAWLETYAATVGGAVAKFWAKYITEDLEYVPALAHTREQRRKIADRLMIVAGKPPVRESPKAELLRYLDKSLATPMRLPLLIASGRLALAAGETAEAFHFYLAAQEDRVAAAALQQIIANKAVIAADRVGYVENAPQVSPSVLAPELLLEQVDATGTARAAAGALAITSPGSEDKLLAWAAKHLGMEPEPRTLPALTLTLPDELGPRDPTSAEKWDFLSSTLSDVRRVIAERFGITIPSILVRTENTRTIGLSVGIARTAELDVHPVDGASRDVEGAARALLVGEAGEFTKHTRIGGWLVNQLGNQLATIVTIQDISDLAAADPLTAQTDSTPRAENLLQLARLARSLLMEQIGLVPWRNVAEAAVANRKSSLDTILSETRLRLTAPLGAAVRRAGGEDPDRRVDVPIELEQRVKAMLRWHDRNSFLAALPGAVNVVVEELAKLLAGSRPPILVVTRPDVRPWIRRLATLADARAVVFTRAELAAIGLIKAGGERRRRNSQGARA